MLIKACALSLKMSRKIMTYFGNISRNIQTSNDDCRSSIKLSYFEIGVKFQFFPINQRLLIKNNVEEQESLTLESLQNRLLTCLVQKYYVVVTREELIYHVWRKHYVDSRTVNCAISKLRKTLGDDNEEIIKTIRGEGYIFTLPVKKHYLTPSHQSKWKIHTIGFSLLTATVFLYFVSKHQNILSKAVQTVPIQTNCSPMKLEQRSIPPKF